MLIQLHNAIEQICPIAGIAELTAGGYRIDFAEEATPEQRQAAIDLIATFQPPEQPNWDQFRSQMLIHSAYLRIVTSSPLTQTINSALVATLWQLGGNPDLLPDVANMWNAIALEADPTEAEIEALNQIGQNCNMPFRLNEQGMMSL